VTLAEAREQSTECHSKLAKGIGPLDAKKVALAAEAARRTFGQCADELIKSKRSEWRSQKHAYQWNKTITEYCGPIWDMPVDEVNTAAVLEVLKPVWARTPETASRLRGRLEAVLSFAKAHKLRSGENPAVWKGNLANILPRRQKLARGHHAALPYHDLPEFIARLRECESIPSLALEFTILTAARSGEVLGAHWDEIDLDAKAWTIPAPRMKAGVEHRVPLSVRAIAIVEKMAALRSGDYVFPGQRYRRALGHASTRVTGHAVAA
jgi:integrase